MERPWGRMTSAFELMRGTDSRLPAAQVDAAFRGKLSIAFRSPDGAKRLGKNDSLKGWIEAKWRCLRHASHYRPEEPKEDSGTPDSSHSGAEKTQKGAFGCFFGQAGEEAIEADDAQHAGEVVAQCHQAPFAAHLVEAAHEEVAIASAALEGAEGMFDQPGAAAHDAAGAFHALAMALDDLFMLPAVDGACWHFGSDAARPQRTGVTHDLPAHITDLDPAAGVLLAALCRLEQRSGRTAVGIGLAIVSKILVAEAMLRLQAPRSLGGRHISDDPAFLAALQGGAIVITDIGRHLHIVAGHCLAVLGQKPRVFVGSRQLRLTTLLKPPQISLQLGTLFHQRRHPLRCTATIAAIIAPVFSRRSACLGAVVRLQRTAIGLNVAVERRKLRAQLLARRNAPFAGVAVKERPINRHKLAAHQIKRTRQKHKLPVRCLERRPIVLAERGDRPVAGLQSLQKPDHLEIATRLARKPARGAHLVEVAVNVQLQKVRRMVRRLAHSLAPSSMAEPELLHIKTHTNASIA